jgi:hypothetical protein
MPQKNFPLKHKVSKQNGKEQKMLGYAILDRVVTKSDVLLAASDQNFFH